MELLVNGETDDEISPPEPSQTLEEYLEQLNEQFGKVNQIVRPLAVNGRDFTSEFNDWTPDEIDQLELTVQPIEDLVVNSLVDLAEYLDRARENLPEILENWEEQDVETRQQYEDQLDDAFSVINQILTSMMGIINIEDRLKPIKQINSRIKGLDEKLSEKDGDELRPVFEETDQLFENLREEIGTIVQVLSQKEQALWEDSDDLQGTIESRLDRIPSLIENLQQSPDSDDYEEIDELVADLERVLGYVEKLDEAGKIKLFLSPEKQEELGETHRELDQGIEELNRAFEEQDVIMICDILEYEVQPYLEQISDFIRELRETTSS